MIPESTPLKFVDDYLAYFPSDSVSFLPKMPYIKSIPSIANIIDLISFSDNSMFKRPAAVLYNVLLSNIVNAGYGPLSRSRLTESNLRIITFYKGMRRNSDKPEAIHPISVEFILSRLKLPDYVLIAGAYHDKIETEIDRHKEKIAKLKDNPETKDSPMSLAEKTDELFKEHFLSLKNMNEDSAKKHNTPFDLKEVLKSTLILQKVTRIERKGRDWYKSIDRMFEMDFDSESSLLEYGLSGVFEEYEKLTGERPTFTDMERKEIVEHSIMVKLADRIVNTLDTYPKQTVKGKLKDIVKSQYVLNKTKEYMKSIKGNEDAQSYKEIKYLRDVLEAANRKADFEMKNKLLNPEKYSKKHSRKIKPTAEEIAICEKELNEYKSKNGFASLDYGFEESLFSGFYRAILNKLLKEDKRVVDRINNSPFEQLVAIKCVSEVNSLLGDENLTLDGFSMLASEQLGYFDDAGQRFETEKDMLAKRFSPEWIAKRNERLSKGVLSHQSYYKVTGEPVTYTKPLTGK